MGLESLTRPEWIYPDVRAADRSGALRILADRLAEQGVVHDGRKVWERLMEREGLGTTALGRGVAVPHCKVTGLKAVTVAVGFCPAGVDFEAEDGAAVRLIFLVISPEKNPAAHLQALAAISRWLRSDGQVERLLGLDEPNEIHRMLSGEGG